MAANFLFCRASATKIINSSQLLNPLSKTLASSNTPLSYQFLRYVHTTFSGNAFQKIPRKNSRNMSTFPDYNLPDTAFGLDSRVPATIITGFLGSGKVYFFLLNLTFVCSFGKLRLNKITPLIRE